MLKNNIFTIACPLEYYKSEVANSDCDFCPGQTAVTTQSIASVNLSDCNICRFSEGSYPEDTCYCKFTFNIMYVCLARNVLLFIVT